MKFSSEALFPVNQSTIKVNCKKKMADEKGILEYLRVDNMEQSSRILKQTS